MQIHVDQFHNIWLTQKNYARSILKRFQMDESRPSPTPADNSLCSIDPKPNSTPIDRPFRCLLGSLLYLVALTRPDLAFSVAYLSRFLDRYNEQHWHAALRILRYLQDTSYSICYKGGTFSQLQQHFATYTDSDFAACKESRKSVSGNITVLNGAAVPSYGPAVNKKAFQSQQLNQNSSAQLMVRKIVFGSSHSSKNSKSISNQQSSSVIKAQSN